MRTDFFFLLELAALGGDEDGTGSFGVCKRENENTLSAVPFLKHFVIT